jgi:hypothetical protein
MASWLNNLTQIWTSLPTPRGGGGSQIMNVIKSKSKVYGQENQQIEKIASQLSNLF